MRNIKLVLEYDGGLFSGWQVQPDERTVQGVLESALFRLVGESIRVTGAGRTDAGVHALAQVANFRTGAQYPPDVFQRALNALLPRDVAIKEAGEADDGFDARRSAKSKLYRYHIRNRGERSVFDNAYSWHFPRSLDIDAMRRAAGFFIGTHDFSSFRSSTCSAKTTNREIYRLDVISSDKEVRIEVSASGFLKQMVRTIVGTLVSIGEGKLEPDRVVEIMEAGDRRLAGPTAPARGLFLVRVDYDIKEDRT